LPGSSFSAIFTKTHALGVPVVSFRQTIDNSSPSLDGESMQFNNYGEAESNVLWFYDNGAQNNAYYFYSDQWFYLDANGATGNALEYDQWKYVHAGDGGVTQNTRFMFGGQCDLNHHLWDVWNSYTGRLDSNDTRLQPGNRDLAPPHHRGLLHRRRYVLHRKLRLHALSRMW